MVLLRPKWLAGHALALVLTSLFVTAGFWQIARNHQANDKLAHEKAALDARGTAISSVDLATASRRETRVEASGEFVTGHSTLLRGQLRGDKDGSDVLTPLRLADGRMLLVDRGWVSDTKIVTGWRDDAVPRGQVSVRGPLLPPAPLRSGEAPQAEAGLTSYPRVDIARISRATGVPLASAYVSAQYMTPAPTKDAPELPQPAKVTEVNHISYAIQWFSFAAIAVIGWPIVLTRAVKSDRKRRGATTPAETQRREREPAAAS